MNVLVFGIACLLTLGGCKALSTDQGKSVKANLHLAVSNQTEYVIVRPEKATEVDDYAVNILTNFLFQKTGAVFPVVLPGQISPANKYIFVGLSDPAIKILGKDPLAPLKDQEYVTRNVGNDIFLYGKGIHGNFHATVDFLETEIGVRWYTWRQKPVVPPENTVALKPFDRKQGFAFKFRGNHGYFGPKAFYYWHGVNALLDESRRMRRNDKIEGIVDFMRFEPMPHTLHSYIPNGSKPK